jgi:hypothetical protein
MAMLYGPFRLNVLITRRRSRITTRYAATVIRGANRNGQEVTVKFENCEHSPDEFLGLTGDFDGDENDIRDLGDRIDQHRMNRTFHNPFIR